MKRYGLTVVLIALSFACLTRTGFATPPGSQYVQTNLVSDIAGLAAHTDPTLRNPWGVAFFAGLSPFWVNDNNAGVSALYDGTGIANPGLAAVTIPAPGALTGGTPTGIVANFFASFFSDSGAFLIPGPAHTDFGPALFIFATEDGTIEAWNTAPFAVPGIPDPSSAVIVVDNSAGGGPTGAVYKGLALGANAAGHPFLYATNFRSGKVEVFDAAFAPATLSGSFNDPNLPSGYAPFGIQNVDGRLYVTYAVQNAAKHDDVSGPAHGIVDIFDTDGNLLRRFLQHGHLNSPWGVTAAPSTFGRFANDILVGNFGNGRINAYDLGTGAFAGYLRDAANRPIVNPGLWTVTFGGAVNSSPETLYFTAGLNDEQDGLFGSIDPE